MLHMAGGGRITRVHGPFVSDEEVEDVVRHLRTQGEPDYNESVTDEADDATDILGLFDNNGDGEGSEGGSGDALYDQAVALVAREKKASTSFIQRHLKIGYNRAATLIERMEQDGVVSSANHVGKREVLVGDHSGRREPRLCAFGLNNPTARIPACGWPGRRHIRGHDFDLASSVRRVIAAVALSATLTRCLGCFGQSGSQPLNDQDCRTSRGSRRISTA